MKHPIKSVLIGVLSMLSMVPLSASMLKQQTKEAFQSYIAAVETELQQRAEGKLPFIQAESSPTNRSLLLNGRMIVSRLNKNIRTPGGIVHDWSGTVFYPGVSIERVTSILLDYDSHKTIFSEVIDSKILEESRDSMTVFLRFKKKEILTVVTDTYHTVSNYRISANKTQIHSRSTLINEVDNFGKDDEKLLPEGEDHGFLWRMNSYWSLEEIEGGVMVECRSVTLSRDVPFGLDLIIGPIINRMPRESLESVLNTMKDNLSNN